VQDDRVTVLGNFTVLVPVNNTPVVALAGRAYAASSWPHDSLLVSLDLMSENYRIVQNSGGGKLWQIECHLPIFYPTRFIFIFCKTVDF